MNDDIAIKVNSVSKTFKLPHEKQSSVKGLFVNVFRRKHTIERQTVLDNVSFDIKQGDFFAIVGRNGSGKSTLLKLIAGIYSPTKGVIQVNGKLTPFIELGVGFNPELTGRENVFLNGALLGFNRKEMLAMYQEIVDFAEIERFMDQKLKNYSSGMQVRLAFSIAIRAKSDILLIDEVLAVGDAAFQQKCFDYFEELKDKNQTVVFVSHDMGSVKRFCNKAVYIKDGKLTHIGTPSEIGDVYTLENIESGNVNKDPDLPATYKVSQKILKQTDKSVLLEFHYATETDDDLYVGMALIKDGRSLAEINTSKMRALKGTGKINYSLDTTVLNPGVYYVTVALFRSKNKELVSIGKTKLTFVIKGDDMTRGAAIKLPDSWESK